MNEILTQIVSQHMFIDPFSKFNISNIMLSNGQLLHKRNKFLCEQNLKPAEASDEENGRKKAFDYQGNNICLDSSKNFHIIVGQEYPILNFCVV